MLNTVRELRRHELVATDGVVGRVDDLYFDDQTWDVRFLVAKTGLLLPRRSLVPSEAICSMAGTARQLRVSLTRDQAKGGLLGDKAESAPRQPTGSPGSERDLRAHPHLQSAKAVMGYWLLAADGPIGHVRDFLIDIEARTVCSVVVGTRNWLPGGKVMMPPWHVTGVPVEKELFRHRSSPHNQRVPEVLRIRRTYGSGRCRASPVKRKACRPDHRCSLVVERPTCVECFSKVRQMGNPG